MEGALFTATKGEQHQGVDEKEFDNIYYHSPKRNLEWAEMRIHAKYMDKF